MMPKLRESKLYECLVTKSISEIRTAFYNHIHCGKDINVRDSGTGETYLHCLCDVREYLLDENGVSIVYLLGCSGLDLDIKCSKGEAFLHKIVRIPGSYRALVAAVRCGADMMVRDSQNRTPEDILLIEKPEGWQEMLHWWNKYTPGLYRATLAPNLDISLVERLLKYWCNVNIVKQGKTFSVSAHELHPGLEKLIKKYRKSNELILTALTGHVQAFQDKLEKKGAGCVNLDSYDWSFQRDMESPETPLPPLQYVWMMNNPEMSELLLDSGADPAVLFTWGTEPPKPLFFQLVCNKSTTDEEIIYKTLEKSNMLAKDYDGQTVLYEAIRQKSPAQFVKYLLRSGVNIAARDKHGQTARDYAVSPMRRRKKYQRMIDKHVATMIANNNTKYIANLMIQGYDFITDLDTLEEGGVISLAKSRTMTELLETYEETKAHIQKMLKTAQTGRLAELRPLMSRKFMAAVDIAGRNVCHIAVVHKRREFIQCICNHYPLLLNQQDNLGRTPFHYAQVLLEGDEIVQLMTQCGASSDIKDIHGRTPEDYKCSNIGEKTFYTLQTEIKNYAMDVYTGNVKFQEKIDTAIKDGDIATVTKLIKGLKYHLKDNKYLNRYNHVLFNCLETRHQDIAVYLIQQGMDINIFKQYKKCSPAHKVCRPSQCKHRPYSLREVADHMGADQVLTLMNSMEKDREIVESYGKYKSTPPMAFSQFGLL